MIALVVMSLVMVPVTVITALRMRRTDRNMAAELDRRIGSL